MPSDKAFSLSAYDYELPRPLIAQHPSEPREDSRLMVLERQSGEITHGRFRDIGKFLASGDLLVLNDTKVIPARVLGSRSTGGKVEALFVREVEPGQWEVMLKAGKVRQGEVLDLAEGQLPVRLLVRSEASWIVSVPRGRDVIAVLNAVGRTPLPPYILRSGDVDEEARDRRRYQTVFARVEGAVAAPTAGLHFTRSLLEALMRRGIRLAYITLHVGPGTFVPVRTEDIRQHKIHSEFYRVPPETAEAVAETEAARRRVVAVGTTSCRVLEAAGDRVAAGEGWTDLFIYPPFPFHHTKALLTNFHLPRTTLLMLVAAFAGRKRILAAYEEAVGQKYRFYSYGDAMLIL
jgi:S-adenosylmethionine:tRNA ribosyltransferase-isomerase